ncbi:MULTISPECIES: MFS transporter [Methylobacterium]|uniref:Staphyloferrin B transporter n=1 Tax=Methylobacterium thuringiense TaxID=1003091 RepID=A0ABQ4TT04_9HYPH|nr:MULTISPECIES: MFS transporter [Methylobacterium]TXN20961.1 MFS transporter [Methylobacterium sp. WL9]GJE57053.1 Staphyloferrin B transporter [Methylobacterium thuringiense]
MSAISQPLTADVRTDPVHPYDLLALVALQTLVTAAPLALLPFLGMQVAGMSDAPAFWTAMALAAPAVTTLTLTPAWARLAVWVSLPGLILWTGLLSALSCAMIASATHPLALVLARLVQGAAGGGVVLALAFREVGLDPARGYTRMQQAVSAGCLIGPLVGGLAFEHGRFTTLMLACGGLVLVASLGAAALCRGISLDAPEGSAGGRITGWPVLGAGLLGSAGAFAFVAFFPTWATAADPAMFTPGLIGLLHSSSWLVALLVLPFWARGIGALSPLTALALSLAGCALAFAAIPLGLGLVGIAVLRLLQGALFAGQSPALFAAAEAAGPNRVAAIAHVRASLTLGQLAGPFVAGLVLVPFGPAGAIWAAAGLSLAGAVWLVVAHHPIHRKNRSRAA